MIENIISREEKIIWEGTPNKFLYIIGPVYVYLIAVIWFLFDWNFLKLFMTPDNYAGDAGGFQARFHTFFIVFILVHLAPVWYAILGPIFRIFIVSRIKYIITNRKIYIVSGILGTDILSVDLENSGEASISVNPVENVFGVGSIRLSRHHFISSRNSGRYNKYTLKHIKEPYEVYAQLNEWSKAAKASHSRL